MYGSIAANTLWMANAFNHKPLLSGTVWSLRFSAYSPMGGRVNYQYRFKYRSWQSYNTFNNPAMRGQTPNRPNLLFRILYGY